MEELKYWAIGYSVDPNSMSVVYCGRGDGGFATRQEAAERIVEMTDERIETLKASRSKAMGIIREWTKKPTKTQQRVIDNIALGRDAAFGFSGRSEFGGLSAALHAMHNNGLLEKGGTLGERALQFVKRR